MSDRITDKDLECLVETINKALGFAVKAYSTDPEGRRCPNAGTYLLDYAYGGVRLKQNSLTPGCTGWADASPRGTERECYNFMRAFIAGIDAGNRNAVKPTSAP